MSDDNFDNVIYITFMIFISQFGYIIWR